MRHLTQAQEIRITDDMRMDLGMTDGTDRCRSAEMRPRLRDQSSQWAREDGCHIEWIGC